MDVRDIAGGVGVGLKDLFNANLCKGSELVLKLLSIDDHVKDADLLITADGKFNSQAAYGKVLYVAAEVAKKYNIPVCLIVGQVDANGSGILSRFD